MNLSFFFTLGFALVCVMSTHAHLAPKSVVDWKGDPLKVGVLYDMWAVGKDKGPVAVGSALSPNTHFVIAKPYRKVDPFLPDPVTFYPTNTSEEWVHVNQDYKIKFGPTIQYNYWRKERETLIARRYCIISNSTDYDINNGDAFQLELVDEHEHLYKLTTQIPSGHIPYPFPYITVDINSRWSGGEDRLCTVGSAINLRFVEHKSVIQEVV